MGDEKGAVLFAHTYIRMFFLLAPFFGVSMFLKMSEGLDRTERFKAAIRTSIAIIVAIYVFFFFGKPLFYSLGITLPAFQIGAGSILFISSAMLVLGFSKRSQYTADPDDDFSIVPLAIPVIVGPGTIGTMLVWGTEITGAAERATTCLAFLASGLTVSLLLFLAEQIEKILGQKVLAIITKITALILTSLAAQIIFTGIKSFMAE